MKKTVKLLDDKINVDVRKFLDGKLLLQANTGGGKSWAIRRILEQLYDVVPQIILDTEGEFHTLRERYDYILVGKGQPITADYKSAGLLAHKMIESRCSYIIDLFELTPYEREMFVKNFVEAMTNAPKKLWLPTLLVIDEAQTYAPEGDKTETGRALHDAAFKFRKRHYGILFATPRIAALSKNVISACKNKLIGYTSYEGDVKRAGFELGFTTKEQLRSLRDLDPGQFFAFGPAFSKEVVTIQIGHVKTSHGEEGEVNTKTVKPSPKTLKALAVLATVPQAAAEEAKTTGELKAALTVAKRRITELEKHPATDKKAIENALKTRDMEWTQRMQNDRKVTEMVIDRLMKVGHLAQKIGDYAHMEVKLVSKTPPEKIIEKPFFRLTSDGKKQMSNVRDEERGFIGENKDTNLGKGEREILTAIAQYEEATTKHIAVLTGYKATSRREYLRKLVAAGYVRKVGESYLATQAGLDALGDFTPLPTGRALLEHLMQTLPEGEKKLFSAIVGEYPNPVTKEWLQTETNYRATSVREYARKLIARKIVEMANGGYKASDKLYD